MSMRFAAIFALACLAGVSVAQAAGPSLDIVPAAGAQPIHLRISQVNADPEGPRLPPTDIVLRRTGPTTAVLQRGTDVSPLVVGIDGSLQLDKRTAPANEYEVNDLLVVLNIAHSVVGVASAGDRAGWIAQIPAPARVPAVVVSPAPSPPPPLLLPMRAVAPTGTNGGIDIDGALEMVLAAPVSGATPAPAQQQASQRSRGGGGRGGFGGSRGGSGYPAGAGEGPRGAASLPVTFDLRISGHIASNALTHMTIAQTRRVQYDGLMYTNLRTWTIDVVR